MAKRTRRAQQADHLYRGSIDAPGTYHSTEEYKRPAAEQVYHNTDQCPEGREILPEHRAPGPGGYRLCDVCRDMAVGGSTAP